MNKWLSILADDNGQLSTTRVVLLLVVICIATEWQYAIWTAVTWTPSTWELAVLGGATGLKIIQKPFEKKA